jgi:hypothetical protein
MARSPAFQRVRGGKRKHGVRVGSAPRSTRSTSSRKAFSASPTATASHTGSAPTSSGTIVQWTPPTTRGRSGSAARSAPAICRAQAYCWVMTEKPTSPGPYARTRRRSSSSSGTSNSFSFTWTRAVSWPAALRTPEMIESPWLTPIGQSMFG